MSVAMPCMQLRLVPTVKKNLFLGRGANAWPWCGHPTTFSSTEPAELVFQASLAHLGHHHHNHWMLQSESALAH